jgi:hypothetical protein
MTGRRCGPAPTPEPQGALDINKLLTAIIDGTVENLADALVRPGENVLLIRANLYRSIRDACDVKAELAVMLVQEDQGTGPA